MKLGAESRNKMIAAGVLGTLALVLLVNAFWGGGGSASSASTTTASSPVPAPVTPTATKKTGQRTKTAPKKKASAPSSLDPELRYDWLRASEDTKYEGKGRNIFSAQAPPPEPIAPANTDTQEQADAGPPPPPPPPPINLKFFGFASKPGESKKVFLSQGEDVFIASEGDTVNRRYKVVRISPASVEIEDQMNNNHQNIPLTQG
jgi:hypothetical protein